MQFRAGYSQHSFLLFLGLLTFATAVSLWAGAKDLAWWCIAIFFPGNLLVIPFFRYKIDTALWIKRPYGFGERTYALSEIKNVVIKKNSMVMQLVASYPSKHILLFFEGKPMPVPIYPPEGKLKEVLLALKQRVS